MIFIVDDVSNNANIDKPMPNENDPTGIWYSSAHGHYLLHQRQPGQQSGNDMGIIYYTSATIARQPNLFNRLYSEEIWSMAGPVNDVDGWQQTEKHWNCDPFIGNSAVAYTALEHRVMQSYVCFHFSFFCAYKYLHKYYTSIARKLKFDFFFVFRKCCTEYKSTFPTI